MRERFSTEAGRLEAFSDGVLAVIITIMVLELKPPHGIEFGSLKELIPTFLAYLLSFIYVGIYWNNHHHLLRASGSIDGRAMWANLHLLFWLSLAPFFTAWVGENPEASVPTALYGFDFFMAAIAYSMLQTALIRVNGNDSGFAAAVRTDWKGRLSPALYLCGIGLAFVQPFVSDALFALVAVAWFVPDKRLEPVIASKR